MKHYEHFPSSFWAGAFPFLLTASILFFSVYAKVFPNIAIFYFAIFTSVIIASGLVGFERFVEYLGFDVNKEYWRIPIFVFIGAFSGYFIYWLLKLLSGGGLHLLAFPMDFAIASILLSFPSVYSIFHFLVVAIGEEILRAYGNFTFANWLGERFNLGKDIATSLGILISSLFFILLHIPAWGYNPNPFSYLMGLLIASVFSQFGFIFTPKAMGILAFPEFTIYPGIVAHWVYDVLVDQNMRVVPSLIGSLLI